MFLIGGINGAFSAVVPVDFALHDTYWVVAHLHYVLFGGSVFGVFAGIYYWFPKMFGRMLSERLGHWHFWLFLSGFLIAFVPMHITGLLGMPRRVYTYPAYAGWAELNIITTVGAVLMGLGSLVFVWNIIHSLRHGAEAGDDPWDGYTLEWATSSPPPAENFRGPLPEIRSRRPLWDRKHPDRADWRSGHGG
jgi:heme/copper-type cytochrome/quinol oxidase subunit 1